MIEKGYFLESVSDVNGYSPEAVFHKAITDAVSQFYLDKLKENIRKGKRRKKENSTLEEGEDSDEEGTDAPPKSTTTDEDGNEVLNW